MKTMTLSNTGPVESRLLKPIERDPPQPGPGQVVIQVAACGVCHTDLHVIEGEVKARLPIVPGHQAVGTITSLGEGVTDVSKGDLVGVGWLNWTCGECELCRTGRENLCRKARFTGRDADGGYAQQMSADARYVFRLPSSLAPMAAAPLLCAGIIGYRSLKASGIQSGGRLGLIGFGASAHLAIQVALHWGCEVYAFDRKQSHRQLAIERGALWAGSLDQDPGVLLDAAVTFAPVGEIVPRTLDLLERGAAVAINAIHSSPIPSFAYDRLYWEKSIRSVANFTRADAKEFLELASKIPIRADVEPYPMSAANDALIRLKNGEVRGAAVLAIES